MLMLQGNVKLIAKLIASEDYMVMYVLHPAGIHCNLTLNAL